MHFRPRERESIRKCFRNPVKIRSAGQTQSHSGWEQREGAGAQYTLCRGRSVPRLSPRPQLHTFAPKGFHQYDGRRKSTGLGSKSAAERLRGWETVSFPQPSTIPTFCAHHTRRYISHPDEVGERKFRFAPSGHGWKKTSGRGRVRASPAIRPWPPTHSLAGVRAGRRISAQRRAWKLTTTYDALRPLYSIFLQFGPPRWENVFHSR